MGSTASGTRALCVPDSKEVALGGGQGVQGRAPLLGSRRWGLFLFGGHKQSAEGVTSGSRVPDGLLGIEPRSAWVQVRRGKCLPCSSLGFLVFVFMEGGCSPKTQLPGSQAVFLDSKLADV